MAVFRSSLSGLTPFSPSRDDRRGRKPRRTGGPQKLGTALLPLFCQTRCPSLRRRSPSPLGNRKPATLGARRRLPRRPHKTANRIRTPEYGCRQTHRHETGAKKRKGVEKGK